MTDEHDVGASDTIDMEDSDPSYTPQLGSETSENVILLDNPANRRRDERIPYYVGVNVEFGDHGFLGLAGNISEGGLFIATREEVEVGRSASLEFLLPGMHESLELDAVVRWVGEGDAGAPGFGVEIEYFNAEERELLQRVVEQLKEEQGELEADDDS